MQKRLFLFIVTILMFLLIPSSVLAADTDGDGYNDTDVETLKYIINNSETLKAKYPETTTSGNYDIDIVTWSDIPGESYKVIAALYGDTITDYKGNLDISALAHLETIIFNGNSGLTSINLPVSNTLSYINLEYTGITEIDLSKVPELAILYLSNTNITEIDLSNNTKLEELTLSNVTGLKELDVTKNSNLNTLVFDRTQISSIDLSNNPLLTFLVLNSNIENLITPEGNTITIKQSNKGKITLLYNATDKKYILEVVELNPEKYKFVSWNGLPDGVSTTKNVVAFTLKEDLIVSANFEKVEVNPPTGDTSNPFLWISLIIVSLIILIGTTISYHKSRK